MNIYHEQARKVQFYLEDLFGRESSSLVNVRRNMDQMGLPPIQITPLIGKTLQLLIKIAGAKTILEIGTLGGYSAIWMAEALPTDGKLLTIEQNPLHCTAARANISAANLTEVVEVIEGEGLPLLEAMIQKGTALFDFIFLDADKSNYPHYLEPIIQLTRPGGLIVIDNLVRRGKVLSPGANDRQTQAVALLNQMIANDQRLESVILPTLVGYKGGDLDGISISRKRADCGAQ